MPLQQFKKELSVSRRLSGLGSVPEVTGEMTSDSALWESLRAPKKILNFGTKIKAVLWIFWVFMPRFRGKMLNLKRRLKQPTRIQESSSK